MAFQNFQTNLQFDFDLKVFVIDNNIMQQIYKGIVPTFIK